MSKRIVVSLVALTALSGCGTLLENDRTIEARNHHLCGVSAPTLIADVVLGVVPVVVDAVTGGLFYSDKECK